ncbi:hypothetical protein MBLNU459_g7194t1 [Dothideomycetes sp. NU459]
MRLSGILLALFRFLLPPAIIASVLLYAFPVVQNCSFPGIPDAHKPEPSCLFDGNTQQPKLQDFVRLPRPAPFRLLALGDPQLEGDTSLPDPNAPLLPSLRGLRARLELSGDKRGTVGAVARELVTRDVPRLARGLRKRLDLVGNDLYLAHNFRLVRWWTKPTHMVVLGDLLGSQWIGDEEFEKRAQRFWTRVFGGTERVPDNITGLGEGAAGGWGGAVEVLGDDETGEVWRRRLINVAGNHDVGYAGDIDAHRIQRFESTFGGANWVIKFQLPWDQARDRSQSLFGGRMAPPALELVVLNSMNLDSPAWQTGLQQDTHEFLDAMVERENRSRDATVLLTHIPLFKQEGVCVDGPFFDYFPADQGGGIREQNHLTRELSDKILNGLFSSDNSGRKSNGIILNGHDHEGCDVLHHRTAPSSPSIETVGSWQASRHYPHVKINAHDYDNDDNDDEDDDDDDTDETIREITVRSMMGSYGGNVGLLSAWFDDGAGEWRFDYATCSLGVQHIWWAIHILDLVVALLGIAGVEALRREWSAERREQDRRIEERKKSKKQI